MYRATTIENGTMEIKIVGFSSDSEVLLDVYTSVVGHLPWCSYSTDSDWLS